MTPVAGLTWHAARELNVYANAGRGFETPTFTELAYRNNRSGLNTALWMDPVEVEIVKAEYGAGSGTATGLAWRIVEAGNRLQIARMFAALALLAILGIIIFFALALMEFVVLRKWHESAVAIHK